LIEELATYLSFFQIKKLKIAWKNGIPVQGGYVPKGLEKNKKEMFSLLNTHAVLQFAKKIALSKNINQNKIDTEIRNLILTEDFTLMSEISKHAKEAIDSYSEKHLAAMIASKRIEDFKETLSIRNTLSMDSPSTYGWILHQARKNERILEKIPCFEELFAKKSINTIAEILEEVQK